MEATRKQKIITGTLSIIYVLIIIGIVVLVNVLGNKYYYVFDTTKTKVYSLSEKTKNVLNKLNKDVEIIVLYQKSSQLYKKIKQVLEEYKRLSKHLKIQFIDPDLDVSKTQMIAKKYDIRTANRIIVTCENRIKHLTDKDLGEFDFSYSAFGAEPKLKSFKGEQAITSAILTVVEEKKIKIRFTQGHGEKLIDNKKEKGLTELVRALKRDNYDVKPITLLGMKKLTKEDAQVLAIICPVLKFTDNEIKLIKDYLNSGGNLFLAIDPLYDKDGNNFKTGLEDLLKKYGIEIKNCIVVDPKNMLPFVSPANLFVKKFAPHPVTKNLQNAFILLFLSRAVDIAKGKRECPGYEIKKLAFTSEAAWGETDVTNEKFTYDEGKDIKGPITPVICAENSKTKSKIIVVGDSDFMANYQIGNGGNSLLVLNGFNWLAEKKELIAIPPKQIISVKTTLSAKQMAKIFWGIVVLFPLFIFGLGILVWWRRNRKK